jgi:hypothetical protein
LISRAEGHALFDLSDEYESDTCNPEGSHIGPNVALDLGDLPWVAMLTPGVELPTVGGDPATVGAYEGALYCASGVYRPQQSCLIQSGQRAPQGHAVAPQATDDGAAYPCG